MVSAPFTMDFASANFDAVDAFRRDTEDVTEENLQARIRGRILMALSNKFGALVLTTGNKSELGVGYCTLYGDMVGGLAVISDVPKTLVYRISRYFLDSCGWHVPCVLDTHRVQNNCGLKRSGGCSNPHSRTVD